VKAHGKDLRRQTHAVFARAATGSITAGGAGDNTQVDGIAIDIRTLPSRPASVSFEIPVTATLAAAETCVVDGLVQKSIDGTNWETIVASSRLLTLTGPGGGGTVTGVARLGADIVQSNANFIRFRATPDLSRANTDTMNVGAAVAVFFGLERA
jgi:hypothetical protein